MGFTDPIVADTTLIRSAIRSPNYSSGVSGWTINRDGSAEFADVVLRGDFRADGVDGSWIRLEAGALASMILSPEPIPGHAVYPGAVYARSDAVAEITETVIMSPQFQSSLGVLANLKVGVSDFTGTYSYIRAAADSVYVSAGGVLYLESTGNTVLTGDSTSVTGTNTAVSASYDLDVTADAIYLDSATIGFYGYAGGSQPTIYGSTGGNAALQNLLYELSYLGLIIDSTS